MISMRFLIRAQMPTESGNKLIKDPNFMATLENYLNSIKAEAIYFTEENGERAFYIVADMASADMMPAIAEPLFQGFNAKVEVKPVMVLDDVKKGMKALQK